MMRFFCNNCGEELSDGPVQHFVHMIDSSETCFKIVPTDDQGNQNEESDVCLACVVEELNREHETQSTAQKGSGFKRENRYIVIKRKDLDLLEDETKEELENILAALAIAKQPDIDTGSEGAIECVVVEKDWPMYEQTWKAIEDWVVQEE